MGKENEIIEIIDKIIKENLSIMDHLPQLDEYISAPVTNPQSLELKYICVANILAAAVNQDTAKLAEPYAQKYLKLHPWTNYQLMVLKMRLGAILTNIFKNKKESPKLLEAELLFLEVLKSNLLQGDLLRECKRNYCANILNQRKGRKLLSLISFSYFYDISIELILYNEQCHNKILCEHQLRQMLKNDYDCPIDELMIPSIPKKLFKYRTVNTNNITALQNSQLYLCAPENFNDPFDPIFRIAPEYDAYQNLIAPMMIMGSLSAINDNILMWSHYADAHKGFCIEFDLTDFIKNLPKYTTIRAVRYTDTLRISPPVPIYTDEYFHSILDMFALKYLLWSYEKEYRIFSHQNSNYITLPITSVYLGKDMTDDNVNIITQTLKLNKSVEVYKMVSNINNPYQLDNVRLQ